MTAALYKSLSKTANSLLTIYGKDITITRTVNGAYDTATGNVSNTVTTHTVKGQLFQYKDMTIAMSGGLIKQGDRYIILDASRLTFTPDPNTDEVTVDGVRWAIVAVKKPVDEQVIYELQVRNV